MPKATSWRSPSVPANGPDRDTLPTRDDGKEQWPGLRFAILDGAFSAERCPDWCTIPGMHSSVGEKGPDRKGFVVLERRWAVERTFGWPSRWVGFHRERAGRLEVVAGRPACVASLMAANVLYNPA